MKLFLSIVSVLTSFSFAQIQGNFSKSMSPSEHGVSMHSGAAAQAIHEKHTKCDRTLRSLESSSVAFESWSFDLEGQEATFKAVLSGDKIKRTVAAIHSNGFIVEPGSKKGCYGLNSSDTIKRIICASYSQDTLSSLTLQICEYEKGMFSDWSCETIFQNKYSQVSTSGGVSLRN